MVSNLYLTGQVFHQLTVISRNGSTKQQKALWKCKCTCGNIISITSGALRFGTTKSCGCRKRFIQKELGQKRRIIDYSSLICQICGKNISSKFLDKHNNIIRRLTRNTLSHITCTNCFRQMARDNGRIPSIKNSQIEFTYIHEQVILGSFLGDGNFEKSPVDGNPQYGLSIKHGLKQTAYCLWKADLLGDLITKIDYPQGRIRVRTRKHAKITQIAKSLLKNGKKLATLHVISKLGPLGFAIWYLDDGNLLPNRLSKIGKFKKLEIRFATHSFSEEENQILRLVLKEKIKIDSTKCQWVIRTKFNGELLPKPKHFYGIRLYGENAEKFLTYIRPYVDWEKSGMSYKQDTTLRGPLDNKHTRRNPYRLLNYVHTC